MYFRILCDNVMCECLYVFSYTVSTVSIPKELATIQLDTQI